MGVVNLSRRGILKALGGGLVVGFTLPGCASVIQPADVTLDLGDAIAEGTVEDINAWIRVAPNGVVTLRMGASEMGQGVYTALPMLLAEELDADWSMVRAESAPAHADYRRQSMATPGKVQLTGGSESVRGYWMILREAGASARAMLVAAAAKQWDVKPEDCITASGVVRHGDKSLTYGELAAAAAQEKPPGKVTVKNPSEFTLLGTSPPRLDLPPKVNGTATFGIDVDSPDTLLATAKQCPHYGGGLDSYNEHGARDMPGVVDIFAVDDAVVVVADTFWRAKQALQKVAITWDKGPHADLDTAKLRQLHTDALDDKPRSIVKHDKLEETSLEAVYETMYLEHATMEPMNATAHVQADRVDVWVGTQAPQGVRRTAGKLTGLKEDQVFVHTTFLGGGFGRRSELDFTSLAVKIAQRFDVPVKTIWTREETFARGFYRPAAHARMRADLSGGQWRGLESQIATQNILRRFLPGPLANLKLATIVMHEGISHTPYQLDAVDVSVAELELPIPVGWWRAVHAGPNAFFRESFVDEVAHELKQDPVELRRSLLKESPRDLGVLEKAVAEAGPLPSGQSRGVAVFESYGSFCAQVADVSVTDGEVTVHKVTAAIDCGHTVHLDTIRTQVMGGVTMGISSVLGEGLEFKEAAVVQGNFHQYPLIGMKRSPVVDVHIIDSSEDPGGVGEPGLGPIGPALCNAIFNATGQRIRRLPIGNQLKDA